MAHERSQRRPTVELLWEGKYCDWSHVTPLRAPLPFETLERVEAEEQLSAGSFEGWCNRLILGDRRHVLPSLLPEFAGRIQLAYIDPPFFTGRAPSAVTPFPGTARPAALRQSAHRDGRGRQLDGYLQWFHETAFALRELLAEPATLYVHLDWHVSHYAKVVLDEVFGQEAFRNEIIWKGHNARSTPHVWPRLHDTILVYCKGGGAVFHAQCNPTSKSKLSHTLVTGADGKKYQTFELTAPGPVEGSESGRPWHGHDPSRWGRHWLASHEQLDAWDAQGLIHWPARRGFPRRRASTPFDPSDRQVILGDVWTDIDRIHQTAKERWGYPTQKPESLLERIIEASSRPGDLVLDCFVGAGTTAVVAERLGRRWIAADRGRKAVHITRKRLHALRVAYPFLLQVIGERDRRLWSVAEVPVDSDPEARTLAHRRWVLRGYEAKSRYFDGEPLLHGRKPGRLVHVGEATRPFDRDMLGPILAAAKRTLAKVSVARLDILAWDFAFPFDAEVRRLAATAGVDLHLRRIPVELLDLDAIDRPRIIESDFAPLRELALRMTHHEQRVSVTLTDFVMPLVAIPREAKAQAGAVTHWSQWIDYWAVDWEHREGTFCNAWRVFRRPGNPDLPLQAEHEYPQAGTYLVAVKVIDLLGEETVHVHPIHLRDSGLRSPSDVEGEGERDRPA